MDAEPKPFKIRSYSIKEIINLYGVTRHVFNIWLRKIPDLGEYQDRRFTPDQVEKITRHLGEP